MSFISVSDKAGNLMGIPGTATRLRSLILPLFRTCVTMSSSTTDCTSKLTRPSDKSIWSRACASCGKPLYDTEAILSVPSTSRAVKINSCPAFISIAPFLNRPKRISGPFVSSNRATGFPTFRAAARTASIRLPCSSWEPWEKLNRATFIPALSIASSFSGVSELGPKVQIIFVFFIMPFSPLQVYIYTCH